MKNTLTIDRSTTYSFCSASVVSFKPFIDYISETIQTETKAKHPFYRFILDKFQEYPELYGDISLENIGHYEDILELVASSVLPLIEDKQETIWALGNAFTPDIFYGSQSFYQLIKLGCPGAVRISLTNTLDKEEVARRYKRLQYAFILEKLYGVNSLQKREWIQSFINPETGLYQYFRVNVDRRFVEVHIKGELPRLEDITVQLRADPDHDLSILEEMLPLDLFEGKGFTLLTFTDVTPQHALEQISKLMTPQEPDTKQASVTFEHMNRLLQTIVGNAHYQFGLLPFPRINNRPAVLYERHPFSLIGKACMHAAIPREQFISFANHFLKWPRTLMYPAFDKKQSLPLAIRKAFEAYGIGYYSLFPIYHQKQVVGILEVCTFGTEEPLNILHLGRLRPTFALLGQFLHAILTKFNEKIDYVIKDKFTNIQSSVQWRFNEVAWHFLRNNFMGARDEAIEKISFKDMYPLYGAVDVRNSTVEQNRALQADLQLQLKLLVNTLQSVSSDKYQAQIQFVIQSCWQWRQLFSGSHSTEEEIRLHEFLKSVVHPLLHQLSQISPAIAEKIQHYWDSIDEQTGFAFENRRQLEASMQLINNTLNRYFDEAKESLQAIYPSYFEKCRTDGIEYDIYIGQALAPKIPFRTQYLEQLRFWQVKSMAAIAQLTHGLLPQMARPLQTTQLLFVYPQTIDINFRQDERRFDVEGSYNIRYHIVKKRIDKIHIRHQMERLTQPDKIAIVYFHDKDAQEYSRYIHDLQVQNILLDDLEYLDLEELHGVSGLKALRVGVVLP